MDIDMNEQHWMDKKCPPINCRKKQCECGLEKVFLSAALGDDSKDSPIAPKNGEYCNAIVVYEANGHVYIYSKEGIPTLVEGGVNNIEKILDELEDGLAQEILDRQAADNTLQNEIDDIKNSPDVVDIVATYAALQAYDTSKLGDNDIVRVLQDEQHDGQSTYYRWDKQNSTWTYIGAVGDYYTKGQVDTLLAGKQNDLTAGSNISITQVDDDLVISATDTTYSNFVGTDGNTGGTAGLVPAPATTDVGKFLKADGTWDTAGGGGPTVVQTTGTSTTDVMSQNATTSMAFADPTTKRKVQIGDGATAGGNNSTAVGRNATANGNNSLALGFGSTASGLVSYAMGGTATNDYSLAFGVGSTTTGDNALALGNTAIASGLNSVALGYKSKATAQGEINVGLDGRTDGYGNTAYRLISGVHDPVNAQDAATKAYVDNIVVNYATLTAAGAPTTSTAAVSVGQLYYDSTNDDYYYCSAIDTTDPQNPSYTWSVLSTGGGGGPTVVQTIGNSQTDVMSQNATTGMIYNDTSASTPKQIKIGGGGGTVSNYAIRIGYSGSASSNNAISIGYNSTATNTNSMALGSEASAAYRGSVAIGSSAQTTVKGQIMVGTTNTYDGYNSTNYRIISGVHDAQSTNDAVNLGQLNSRVIGSLTAAPTTSTVGSVGSLVATVESGTGHLYICTDDTGGSYTWSQLV